jgi:hypothetical protein
MIRQTRQSAKVMAIWKSMEGPHFSSPCNLLIHLMQSNRHGIAPKNHGKTGYKGKSKNNIHGTWIKTNLAHIQSNGQIPCGNMSVRSSTLSDPHIRSSNTLTQTIRDKTEMSIQGVWNIIWQHLKPQNSHLARARKDATWKCQQKQSPTRYLVTYRRQGISFNLAWYRNHSIPSIQRIPYRQTGKDSERATSQVCRKVKGRKEDCSKGIHRLQTAQRNRTNRHSMSSL